MIGIYKITSPKGKVYVGQSINIEYRFKTYKRMHCKTQPLLYNSFSKYGVYAHSFDILELCDLEDLNSRERHFQELYNSCNSNGLNCKYTNTFDKKGILDSAIKAKISRSLIGVMLGKEIPQHTRDKISVSLTGTKHSDIARNNMSIAQKGIRCSDSAKIKIREAAIRVGMMPSSYARSLADAKNRKLILDFSTGVYYNSAKELSDLTGIKHPTLLAKLNGSNKNNTNYRYV